MGRWKGDIARVVIATETVEADLMRITRFYRRLAAFADWVWVQTGHSLSGEARELCREAIDEADAMLIEWREIRKGLPAGRQDE